MSVPWEMGVGGREGVQGIRSGEKLPKELGCMGDGSLSKHTGIFFYLFPLLFRKKCSSTATREARKKKQHKELGHKGVMVQIFEMVCSVCQEAAAKPC